MNIKHIIGAVILLITVFSMLWLFFAGLMGDKKEGFVLTVGVLVVWGLLGLGIMLVTS